MKFVLKLSSLEHMALVKIGISLWTQNDVSGLISNLRYMDLYPSEWKKIEEKVIEKVPQLSLPQLLKEKVFGVIKPIGLQIFDWMRYYRRYDACNLDSDFPEHLPADLCWTPHDTVDRKRTAEVLVRDEKLSVSRRYRLACDYFLENDIILFWNRLPENLKEYDWTEFSVVRFWSNMKRGGAGHIFYRHLFLSSALGGNKVAAQYFLQKLIPQEREESLKLLVLYVKEADVLCSLLPEMEEKEQEKVFKSDPKYVLECFLQWPWQSFFIGVANCMWDYLSKDNYNKILKDILQKVKDSYKDYNYQKLFGEFFQKSPTALKDSLIEGIGNSYVLEYLFDIKDKENIRLILKDAILTAKEKVIYSYGTIYYISLSILRNEWDFLAFFIRECLPSKNGMLKFKKEFEKRLMNSSVKEHVAKNKDQWNQLFCPSDDTNCESDKRNLEVGESSLSKRFKSLP